jgi:hypothetical protein
MSDDLTAQQGVANAISLEHSKDFVQAYGSALLEWAGIEDALCFWLYAMTGQEDKILRKLYFSGSENKIDLIRKKLAGSNLDPEPREFLELALERAWEYKNFRNWLAHGTVGFEQDVARLVLQDMRSFKNADLRDVEKASIEEMECAAENFRKLRGLIRIAAGRVILKQQGKAGGDFTDYYVHEVKALPKFAHRSE